MNELKNIFNLSYFYIKENEKSIKILKKSSFESEKKYVNSILYIILFLGILYLSVEIVTYIVKLGKPEIFLNAFFLLLEIIIMMKTVLVSMNVFYFSKDIENVLHLPLKPREILISKFNTILFMNYELELIFALIPLFVYGIYTGASLYYFINTLILLIIFPIFVSLVICIIMIFLMKTIKLFKNRDLMQIIISIFFVVILMIAANSAVNSVFINMGEINENKEIVLNSLNDRIVGVNKYFLNINSSVNILNKSGFITIVFNYLKILIITGCAGIIFIFLGNRMYLKQLLKANFYFKVKSKRKIKLNKKCRKNNANKAYIKKEFKLLIKNPMFFIQSIYPIILITIIVSVLLIAMVPMFRDIFQKEEYKDFIEKMKFDIETVCVILGLIQIIGLFNYTAITAFSREGKNAFIIKTLPIGFFKQLIIKSIPQIVINTIASGIVLSVIHFQINEIEIHYIVIMFLLSIILTINNSLILCMIDLCMPKLDWNGEYDILKNNKNKLLQYVLIIFNIIFLILIKEIFEKIDLNISFAVISIIFLVMLISINIYININKNKLYKRLN